MHRKQILFFPFFLRTIFNYESWSIFSLKRAHVIYKMTSIRSLQVLSYHMLLLNPVLKKLHFYKASQNQCEKLVLSQQLVSVHQSSTLFYFGMGDKLLSALISDISAIWLIITISMITQDLLPKLSLRWMLYQQTRAADIRLMDVF